MVNILSEKIRSMSESETIKMAQMARDLAAEGKNVISLSLGEPDFDTPNYIKDAAKNALDAGYTKYTPVPGLVELRDSICKKFKLENNLEFTTSQIVVSNGAKQSIANIAQSVLDPGDEAIILTPYWVSYKAMVEMTGAKAILVSAGIEDDFKVKPQDLARAISAKTKFVLFSSPCNPTGSVYHQSELEALADVLRAHPDILVISDEIYEYINFTNHHFSIGSIEHMRDRTATVNGFSKGFAMTGWRLGYMGGPLWLAEACNKIQGQFTSGASSFGQKAAADILLEPKDDVHSMRNAFKQRRDLIIKGLSEIQGFRVNQPEGAFYVLPDISAFFGKRAGNYTINNSGDFATYLLQDAHVGTVAGSAFGADNCIRISYAASNDDLSTALSRIQQSVERLQ